MSTPTKRGWLVGVLLSALFLFLATRGVRWDELWVAFGRVDLLLVGLAGVAALVQVGARGWRWRYLFDRPPSVLSLSRAQLIGTAANNVLPARAGDVARAFLLQRDGVAPPAALASIVVERLVDILLTAVLLALAFFLAPLPGWLIQAGWVSVGIALLGVVMLTAVRLLGGRPLERLIAWLPRSWRGRIAEVVESFVEGLGAAFRLRNLPGLVVSSVAVVVWMLAPVWFCLHAVGLELPMASAIVVTVFASFALMIPAAPGHVGTLQWACVVALGIYGVADEPALLFSLVLHASQWLPTTVCGLLAMWSRGLRPDRLPSTPAVATPVTVEGR
ncbi:MAG: lysylphosphatidylglycerol synthase transmembrane domain-containing protein [Acidobacteriota bacterium]